MGGSWDMRQKREEEKPRALKRICFLSFAPPSVLLLILLARTLLLFSSASSTSLGYDFIGVARVADHIIWFRGEIYYENTDFFYLRLIDTNKIDCKFDLI